MEEHLAAVATGSAGRFVLVGGEAGAGKTSLVRSFCARQSVRVLFGTCDALAAPHPLAPFLDIAGGHLQQAISRGGRPYEVVIGLQDELRSNRPSILVLEDLHWGDEATLDVVRLLVRRLETVLALVIGTYRAGRPVTADASANDRLLLCYPLGRPHRQLIAASIRHAVARHTLAAPPYLTTADVWLEPTHPNGRSSTERPTATPRSALASPRRRYGSWSRSGSPTPDRKFGDSPS